MRNRLGFDHTVHHEAAANAVAIALRHDAPHGCRPRPELEIRHLLRLSQQQGTYQRTGSDGPK